MANILVPTKTKVNWFSAITTASFTALGGLLQLGYLSPRYGGIALLAASIIQGFSKSSVETVNAPATASDQAVLNAATDAGIIVK